MLWRTHTSNFLLTVVFGAVAYVLLAAVEYSRDQHIADHLLEQIHSRALQDFYELASHVREQLDAEELQLPANLEPFVSQRLTREAWQLQINLDNLALNVIPAASQNGTVDMQFASSAGNQRLIFDAEAWIQALCDDLGYGDIPFSLQYRDQPIFQLSDSSSWDLYRQDEFIFTDLSLLFDRQSLITQMSLGVYAGISAIIASVLMWMMLSLLHKKKTDLVRADQKLTDVQHELQETNHILSHQMQVAAQNQKEFLKKNYELQDLNRSLERAKSQMQFSERLASLGEISAGIIHEINNPVAYIGSNLRELEVDMQALRNFINTLDKASDHLDIRSEFYQQLLASYQTLHVQDAMAEAPLRLEDCLTGIERVRKIIQDMKRLSNSGACEKKLSNINDDIDSVINIASSRIKDGIELKTFLIDLPDLYCNSSQISQVLTNIIVNAIQALEDDGGEICLSERIEGNSIVLEISDNGPGIPEEIANQVFEPFFTTKDAANGTGMGLALCYKLVAEHGGWIDLETSPGNGASFSIHLPMEHEGRETC
ncbi:sensor histidine kinase [Bacterioplanoides sp.]|uniref:sensor histidine kinase n=1 Tax=Bacterioplanoides sp. TaxID=2066072 RepID=UPI003B594BF0